MLTSRLRSWITWITLPSLWGEVARFMLTAPSLRAIESVALDQGWLRRQAAFRWLVFRSRVDGRLCYRERFGRALRRLDRILPRSLTYRFVILPLYIAQLARMARSTIANSGDRLHGEGFSSRRQFGMVMRWCLRSDGGLPYDFYRYDVFRSGNDSFAADTVDPFQIELIVEFASTMRRPLVACGQAAEAIATLQDKETLKTICREQGIPVVDTVASFGRARTAWRHEVEVLPAHDLFLKPVGAGQGTGAARVFYLPRERRYRLEQPVKPVPGLPVYPERPLTADELVAWVEGLSKRAPWLLEPRLLPHPIVANWTGVPTLATVRIVTTIDRGGESRVHSGIFRCAVRDVPVDSFLGGGVEWGIEAAIDLETGRLIRATCSRYGDEELLHQPTTGAPIRGFEIPHFSEGRDMCPRLHEAVAAAEEQAVPVVGWDIAIVEEGPILLEGNQFAGLFQDVTGEPLWRDDVFSRAVLSHLEPLHGTRIPLDPALLGAWGPC
jgi:hypothetical protein